MTKHVVPLTVALALQLGAVSCSSVDPAMEQSVAQVFAQSRGATYDNGKRVGWEEGQWVLLRISSDGARSYRRLSVVGREGDSFRLAEQTVWPDHERRSEALLSGYDPADLSRLEVVDVRLTTSESGAGTSEAEVDTDALEEARTMWDDLVDLMRLVRRQGKPRDITVPGGTFRATWATPVADPDGDDRWVGFAWGSGAVPVVYIAKVDLAKTSFLVFKAHKMFEVVDFGLAGDGGQR